MSNGYQPFPITEFKTGTFTYTQPWIRPADAFEPLTNAYVYRGVVSKRNGYSLFGQVADGNPIMGIMQYIDESTGVPSLVVATTVNLYLYDTGSGLFTAITLPADFTGNISQFFNYTNWQASPGATSYLYVTNNNDPIVYFDGVATALQLQPSVDGSNTIISALDVKVYKNRLLVIKPTLSSDGLQAQSIYWSALSDPLSSDSFRTDIAGEGGFLAAPTGDVIQSAEFLRDYIIVFFTNSTWIFRYTSNDFAPFRWDKVNVSKNTNAPYASIQYDDRVTSIGNTGLIACAGTSVERYDLSIIDYYETNFSESYYDQAFSQRYDNLQQSWSLYVSTTNSFPLVGSIAPGSDKALVYNFLENTWATYTFPIPMTCMGLFYRVTGATWASLQQEWENTDFPWNSFYTQSRAPVLLGGDTTGNVWLLDDESQVTDKEIVDSVVTDVDIVPDIVSTRWNPILSSGQKVQFGYIDIYYYIASVDAENPIAVTLNFYVDNSDSIAASRTLTLDGATESEYNFKRIYVNLIGQFVKMEIDPTVNSYMQFNGFILWARPAGRLTGP